MKESSNGRSVASGSSTAGRAAEAATAAAAAAAAATLVRGSSQRLNHLLPFPPRSYHLDCVRSLNRSLFFLPTQFLHYLRIFVVPLCNCCCRFCSFVSLLASKGKKRSFFTTKLRRTFLSATKKDSILTEKGEFIENSFIFITLEF